MSRRAYRLGMVALLALKLWMVAGRPMTVLAEAGFDDALYVYLASRIASGEWLGAYNVLTLLKSPGFPIWIACTYLLRVPLFLGQDLLYAFACWVFVRALRPLGLHPLAELGTFALLLFDPTSWNAVVARVVREGIHPALTLLVVGTSAGLATHREGSRESVVAWSIGLGAALAAFWVTREEGVWLLPTLALLAGFAVLRLVRSELPDRRARLALASLALPVFGLLVGAICALNWTHYGLFGIVETKHPDLLAAHGALTRVTPRERIRLVPVPRETRQRIYRVSPAFRELAPHLEDEGRIWERFGGDRKPAEEIHGGVFLDALRGAVGSAGHAASAGDAMAFYRRLAREVDAACAAGELACGPARATLRPVWEWQEAPTLARTVMRALRFLVSFDEVNHEVEPSSGPASGVAAFEQLTRERAAYGKELRAAEREPSIASRARRAIATAMGWLSPVLFAAALGAWCWLGLRAFRQRSLAPLFVLATALAGACLSRILLVSYIDVSMFDAANMFYLAPAYPLLLAFYAVVACALPPAREG